MGRKSLYVVLVGRSEDEHEPWQWTNQGTEPGTNQGTDALGIYL
jgi:hypothetical protein